MSMKILAIALSATVFATQLVAATASAGERLSDASPYDDVALVGLEVQTSDLDPTTERGAKALYHRVTIAAERICIAPLKKRADLVKSREMERAARCFDDAVESAVAEVRAAANVDIEVLAGVDRAAARLSALR